MLSACLRFAVLLRRSCAHPPLPQHTCRCPVFVPCVPSPVYIVLRLHTLCTYCAYSLYISSTHARLHSRRALLDAPCAGTCFLCTYSPALAPARSHGALYTTARRPLAGHTLSSFCTLSLVLRSPLALARALRSSCPRTLHHRPSGCMLLQNPLRTWRHFFCLADAFSQRSLLFTCLPAPFHVARMSGLCDPIMPLSTSLGGYGRASPSPMLLTFPFPGLRSSI